MSQINELIDHDMRVDEELSKKSTCTTNGYLVLECSYNCGHKNIITLPLAEHTWDSGIEYNPTCTEDGYTIYTCGECHLVKKEVTEKAAGHTVPEFDKEGNVINWGEKEDLADYSKEEELMTTTGFAVDWQDENYKYEIETGNEATCVKPATYTGKCLVCGAKVNDFSGYHKDYKKHKYETTESKHEIKGSETILTPEESGYHCTVEGCNPESENYWDDASLEPYKKAYRTYIYSSIIGIWMTEEGDEYLIFTKDASGKDYELSVENGVIYGKRNKDVKDVDDGDGKKLDFYTETVSDYTWWLDAKDKKERMAISFESGVETDVRNNPTEIKIDYDSETGVPTRMTIGKTTYAFVSSDIKIDKESGTVVVTEELERYDAANHYYKKSYCDGFGAVIGNAHNFEGNVCEICEKKPKNLVLVTIEFVDGNGDNKGIIFREYIEKGGSYSLGSSFVVSGYLGDGYSSDYNGKTLTVKYWKDAGDCIIEKSEVEVTGDTTFKIFGRTYN